MLATHRRSREASMARKGDSLYQRDATWRLDFTH
jgi:hypothetical protein